MIVTVVVIVSSCWLAFAVELGVTAEGGVEAVVAAAYTPVVLAAAVMTDGDIVIAVLDFQSVQAAVCGSCWRSVLLG